MRTRSLLTVFVFAAGTPAVAQPNETPLASVPEAPPPTPVLIPEPTVAPYAPFAPFAPPTDLMAPAAPAVEFPSHLDSSLATGIVDLSLGATLVGLGWFLQDKPESRSFLGAGLGTIAVGVPMLVVGTRRVKYPRHSEPTYAFGTALASMGGTLSGMGIGLGIGLRQEADDYEGLTDLFPPPDYGPALGLGLAGAVLGLAGAGFMTFGANQASPEDAALRMEKRRTEIAGLDTDEDGKVPRSVGRRTAGQVLVVIGGLSFTGALISGIAQAGCSGEFCGLGQLLLTLPLAGQGLITTAIGIPLWVSGATHVDPNELVAETPTWEPEVSVGAGNATLTMRF
jgi:hypothetical protein